VALSGTGAFGHLRFKGRDWHADGLGPLLGDRGGSYQIGREGLRAVFRPGGPPTALREALVRFAGLSSPDNLAQEMVPLSLLILGDRTAVADYAALVNRCARAGDPVAIGILEQAADDLAETIEFLAGQADVADGALPMIGTGGMIRHSDVYWNRLVKQVSGFLPHVRPLRQDMPQVAGRALAGLGQAIRNCACHVDAAASRERLLATLPPVLAEIRPQQETPLPRTTSCKEKP
jgi:N-acetylglucosamine kinase-like BadF-type ATPase